MAKMDKNRKKKLGQIDTEYSDARDRATQQQKFFQDRLTGADARASQAYASSSDAYARAMQTAEGSLGTYDDMARTGGLDDTAINRFRGGGVYDEFSKTGGFKDSDLANIRRRSVSPISSFYGALKDNYQRMNTVQGGINPGYSGQQQMLAEDAAKRVGDTALDAELGITDRVRSGRQWGAEGMTSSEGALQGLRTRNMLAGAAGRVSIADLQRGVGEGYRGLRSDTPGEVMALIREMDDAQSKGDYHRLALLDMYLKNYKTKHPFGSMLKGAASGAAAGSQYGPWGAAIGGVGGGAAGLFSGEEY